MIIPLVLKKILALTAGVTLLCAWKCAFISHEGFDRSKGLDIVCAVKCLFYSALQFIPMMMASEATIVSQTGTWQEMDDPVMGGGSKGKVTASDDTAAVGSFSTWQGAVKNVSFLNAPGFCSIRTTTLATQDAHAFVAGGLILKVRSSTPEYKGFKVKFSSPAIPVHHGAHGKPIGSQAQAFQVPVSKNGEFQSVFLPFTGFSYDWSDFTGDCTTKDPDGYQHRCCSKENKDVCPTAKQLTGLENVMIYAEGVEGKFHLDVQVVKATDCAHSSEVSHSPLSSEMSYVPLSSEMPHLPSSNALVV